jgi:hypothetical protein
MSADSAEALDVLRAIWRGHGQTASDLDADCGQKSCKRMDDAGVGYDDFAAGDGDLQTAWRARLEREGKLNPSAGTIRDLVLGEESAAEWTTQGQSAT